MEIEQNVWGFTPDGEAIVLYTMRSASGAEVKLTNLGAAVVSLTVPDRDGNMDNVVSDYSDLSSYRAARAVMARSMGGAITPVNRIWESRVEINRVVFGFVIPVDDRGLSGELSIETVYDWDDDHALEITLLAHSTAPAEVDIANHAQIDFVSDCTSGNSPGSQPSHSPYLSPQVDASRWLPADHSHILAPGEIHEYRIIYRFVV